MSDGARAFLALGGAAVLALVTVSAARRIALAIGFLDHAGGHKTHADPVPYLGGAGVLAAFAVAAALLGGGLPDLAWMIGLAVIIGLMGSADDHRLLGFGFRFGLQLAVALAVWEIGIRWEPFGSAVVDLPITLIWVVGLTNAFNLLDNIDGAAGTTAAVAAGGIGAIALHQGAGELAAVAFALSGACASFLLFNLSSSHKIFLGDGGSMPIGFLIAVLAMQLPSAHPDVALLAAVPLAGAAIFDTTLVVVSRYRRRVNILSGGSDHSTHRLLTPLGSARRVCVVFAATSVALCGLAYGMYEMAVAGVLLATAAYVAVGAALVAAFEEVAPVSPPAQQTGGHRAEESA